MTDNLKPSQAAREAFATYEDFTPGGVASALIGKDDDAEGVKIFARFEAAIRAPLDAEIADLRAQLAAYKAREATARADAMEDAAKVADERRAYFVVGPDVRTTVRFKAIEAGEAIRALIPQEIEHDA